MNFVTTGPFDKYYVIPIPNSFQNCTWYLQHAAIRNACTDGNLEAVKYFHDTLKYPITSPSQLRKAIQSGSIELVKYLYDHKKTKNMFKYAKSIAINTFQLPMLQYFCEAPEFNTVNSGINQTFKQNLFVAVKINNLPAVRYFIQSNTFSRDIVFAAYKLAKRHKLVPHVPIINYLNSIYCFD